LPRRTFDEQLLLAHDECRRGAPTGVTAEVLRRALATVIRRHNIPPPSGGDWTAESRQELLHDLIVDLEGGRALRGIADASSDQLHFWNQLKRRIHWWLSDDARTTPMAKHRRRVRAAVKRLGGSVVETNSGLALPAVASNTPWDGRADAIIAAVDAINIDPPPWRADTEKEGPPTTGRSHRELVLAALKAADGPISFDELAAVLALRLGVDRRDNVELPGETEPGAPTSTLAAPGEDLIAGEIAEAIWEELSDRQRYAVPHLHLTVDEALEAIGVGQGGRSTIAGAIKATKSLLEVTLDGLTDDEQVAVAGELLKLHAEWTGQR